MGKRINSYEDRITYERSQYYKRGIFTPDHSLVT